jgi:pyruvate dehydrogenase complex dehydrogenase (E1) component
MLFSKSMDPKKVSGRSGNGETRDWREICEDVVRESSSERVNALLEELLNALEEREGSKPTGASSVRKV